MGMGRICKSVPSWLILNFASNPALERDCKYESRLIVGHLSGRRMQVTKTCRKALGEGRSGGNKAKGAGLGSGKAVHDLHSRTSPIHADMCRAEASRCVHRDIMKLDISA